ncbi:MAG: hypothetical protein LBH43_01605 [Treponema sp.]|jgi:hypothetical protein|nr:hypothetical protein [Treponema sp.]
MKRFWYVLIEKYKTGMVKAAILKDKLAGSQPPGFYKQEPGREIYGEWLDSEAEAQTAVAKAKALNASMVNNPKAA